MTDKINVTIWNEFIHEKKNKTCAKLYPEGIHKKIAQMLGNKYNYNFGILEQEEHGLTEEVLNLTDVLIWWGHAAHEKVKDEIVERVHKRILDGMGLIVLHSGHNSKIFKNLMGTKCNLCWREAAEKERLWVINPYHPITKGIGKYIEIPNAEMYGERFDVPDPDRILFISWFEGGEVFRSGLTYTRGLGKIFYFRPGHETYPVFYNKKIIKVIDNAIEWAMFKGESNVLYQGCPEVKEPLEKISEKDYEQEAIEHPHISE